MRLIEQATELSSQQEPIGSVAGEPMKQEPDLLSRLEAAVDAAGKMTYIAIGLDSGLFAREAKFFLGARLEKPGSRIGDMPGALAELNVDHLRSQPRRRDRPGMQVGKLQRRLHFLVAVLSFLGLHEGEADIATLAREVYGVLYEEQESNFFTEVDGLLAPQLMAWLDAHDKPVDEPRGELEFLTRVEWDGLRVVVEGMTSAQKEGFLGPLQKLREVVLDAEEAVGHFRPELYGPVWGGVWIEVARLAGLAQVLEAARRLDRWGTTSTSRLLAKVVAPLLTVAVCDAPDRFGDTVGWVSADNKWLVAEMQLVAKADDLTSPYHDWEGPLVELVAKRYAAEPVKDSRLAMAICEGERLLLLAGVEERGLGGVAECLGAVDRALKGGGEECTALLYGLKRLIPVMRPLIGEDVRARLALPDEEVMGLSDVAWWCRRWAVGLDDVGKNSLAEALTTWAEMVEREWEYNFAVRTVRVRVPEEVRQAATGRDLVAKLTTGTEVRQEQISVAIGLAAAYLQTGLGTESDAQPDLKAAAKYIDGLTEAQRAWLRGEAVMLEEQYWNKQLRSIIIRDLVSLFLNN